MLEEIIENSINELLSREKSRDKVLSSARRVRMLSKQAIMMAHNDEFIQVKNNLSQAQLILNEMKKYFKNHPELEFYNEVKAAQEEYAEATIFNSVINCGRYPKPVELGIKSQRYLLGLGDVPGEFRREALDALRSGDYRQAEYYLRLMEKIYLSLVSMEEPSLLLKGLRRKLDVTRGVIEKTRAEITAEAGRRRLRGIIEKLLEKLE